MAILSVQSHVAYGHVGNRAAVFPLELLGFDMWIINTVQFSNHSGYDSCKGEVFTGRHIELVWSGIVDRGILPQCEAVLSGYLGDVGIGNAVLSAVEDVRAVNPGAIYCCDPVMGEYGKGLYVRSDIPDFMIEHSIPRATIVTPNQFEAETLTNQVIQNADDARSAAASLKELGPQIVLIKSFTPDGADPDTISIFLSCEEGDYVITTPEIKFSEPVPHGVGDLTSALFLGHYLKEKNAPRALELTVESVYSVLELTFKTGAHEMELVKARDSLIRPEPRFKAVKI